MMIYNFYDTCSLLMRAANLFDDVNEKIIISSITLQELENIKTSINKDAEIKYNARKLLRTLDENPNKYEVVIFKESMLEPIQQADLPINDDMRILACAIWQNNHSPAMDDLQFITNDLAFKQIANLFFGHGMISSISEENTEEYLGYKEIQLNDQELANLYSNITFNKYNLLENQYLIIRDQNNKIVDTLKWKNDEHHHLTYGNLNSRYFGEIKPMKGDIYQTCLIDSLINNQLTLVKGPAGSGKSCLALAYLFSQMERGKIDKIIVFCNTVATKNSARLG